MKKIAFGLSAFVLAIGGFLATKANKFFVYNGSGNFMASGSSIGTFAGLTQAQGFTTTTSGKKLVQLIKTNGTSGSGTVLATLKTNSTAFAKSVYHN